MKNTPNPIACAVLPSFERADLHFQRDGEATVTTSYQAEGISCAVTITYYSQNEVLLLRFRRACFPELIQSPDLADLALAINERRFFIKVGRDPHDGEIVIDAELPLLGNELSPDLFGAYFAGMIQHVNSLAPRLMKVRWGAMTVEDALGRTGQQAHDEPGTEAADDSSVDESAPAERPPETVLEHQIARLLDGLDAPDIGAGNPSGG